MSTRCVCLDCCTVWPVFEYSHVWPHHLLRDPQVPLQCMGLGPGGVERGPEASGLLMELVEDKLLITHKSEVSGDKPWAQRKARLSWYTWLHWLVVWVMDIRPTWFLTPSRASLAAVASFLDSITSCLSPLLRSFIVSIVWTFSPSYRQHQGGQDGHKGG